MKIKASSILSSVISVMLVGWILDCFGYFLGFLICLIIALILLLVAGGLEKVAKVLRAVTEQLTNQKR